LLTKGATHEKGCKKAEAEEGRSNNRVQPIASAKATPWDEEAHQEGKIADFKSNPEHIRSLGACPGPGIKWLFFAQHQFEDTSWFP
jgi:hypothetical protein